jgi:ABC-type phosphate transport system ATPase subunit
MVELKNCYTIANVTHTLHQAPHIATIPVETSDGGRCGF